MTYRLSIVGAAALLASCAALADMPPIAGTNATLLAEHVAGASAVQTSTPAPLQQLEAGVTAGYDALKALSFTNGVAGGLFAIRHQGDYGGGVFARTANPTGVNVGFALAAVYEKEVDPATLKARRRLNFYDATVNISLTGTTVVPFLNWPVDYVVESGPAANLANPKTVYEQSLVGFEKTWRFGGKTPGARAFALTVEVGEGHCSRWGDGFFQQAALAATFKPHGW